MAWHLVRYAEKRPESTVVVLAGITHAAKRGIPEQIRRMSQELTYRVILPALPGEPREARDPELADYLLMY
jgi:uncharacterized iron-regulated protein